MRATACLLVVFVLSCSSPTEPLPRPPGAVPMEEVPALYETWHGTIEECVHREYDFDAIDFYIVPGGSSWFDMNTGRRVRAQVYWPNEVYIAESNVLDWDTVAHELGHVLIQSPKHPDPPFGECVPRFAS